jgi:type IV pilus assembly protein PilX
MNMQSHFHRRESGAALIVGLMILLLATFLAVAAMNNSGMQEKMASNAQFVNQAFQAAESAIDSKVADISAGDTSLLSASLAQMGLSSPNWPTFTYNVGNSKISTNAVVRGINETICQQASSISADEGTSGIPAYIFEIRSTSQISGSDARVRVTQGLERC